MIKQVQICGSVYAILYILLAFAIDLINRLYNFYCYLLLMMTIWYAEKLILLSFCVLFSFCDLQDLSLFVLFSSAFIYCELFTLPELLLIILSTIPTRNLSS